MIWVWLHVRICMHVFCLFVVLCAYNLTITYTNIVYSWIEETCIYYTIVDEN